jgi:hypothetical protein
VVKYPAEWQVSYMFAVILKLDGRTESYQFIAKPSLLGLLGLIGLEAPDDTDPKDILNI